MRTNLKLSEIYTLDIELNGFKDETGQRVTKGLLNEKLSLVLRFWLNELNQKVALIVEQCELLKQELIKKYGTELEDGSINIEVMDKENPKKFSKSYLEFLEDWTKLLEEEKELEHKEFKLSSFDSISTEAKLSVIFKLITE